MILMGFFGGAPSAPDPPPAPPPPPPLDPQNDKEVQKDLKKLAEDRKRRVGRDKLIVDPATNTGLTIGEGTSGSSSSSLNIPR